MLGNIKTAFNHGDKTMMWKVIAIMAKLKLEYAVAWSLHKKKQVRKQERIQRIATNLMPELKE